MRRERLRLHIHEEGVGECSTQGESPGLSLTVWITSVCRETKRPRRKFKGQDQKQKQETEAISRPRSITAVQPGPPVPGIVHDQHQATERPASSPDGLEHRRSGRRREDASADGRRQHALTDVPGEGRLVAAPAPGDQRHLPGVLRVMFVVIYT